MHDDQIIEERENKDLHDEEYVSLLAHFLLRLGLGNQSFYDEDLEVQDLEVSPFILHQGLGFGHKITSIIQVLFILCNHRTIVFIFQVNLERKFQRSRKEVLEREQVLIISLINLSPGGVQHVLPILPYLLMFVRECFFFFSPVSLFSLLWSLQCMVTLVVVTYCFL